MRWASTKAPTMARSEYSDLRRDSLCSVLVLLHLSGSRKANSQPANNTRSLARRNPRRLVSRLRPPPAFSLSPFANRNFKPFGPALPPTPPPPAFTLDSKALAQAPMSILLQSYPAPCNAASVLAPLPLPPNTHTHGPSRYYNTNQPGTLQENRKAQPPRCPPTYPSLGTRLGSIPRPAHGGRRAWDRAGLGRRLLVPVGLEL